MIVGIEKLTNRLLPPGNLRKDGFMEATRLDMSFLNPFGLAAMVSSVSLKAGILPFVICSRIQLNEVEPQ